MSKVKRVGHAVRKRIRAKAHVNVWVDLIDVATGAVIERQETHNLVVNAGLNMIRDMVNGTSVAGVSRFAIGTGTNPVQATDTALQTEVLRDVFTGPATTGAQNLTIQYYLSSTSANGNTLTEAGLFNAASAGTMYARVLLASAIVKSSAVAVSFTWTLTWGAS